MPEGLTHVMDWCAYVLEAIGVGLIVLMAAYSLIYAAVDKARHNRGEEIFLATRLRLARGILLGLEFLVAADIIHTVAVELTFESVGVLAIVVLIRTFLSFTLEVETTGRWPWQKEAG